MNSRVTTYTSEQQTVPAHGWTAAKLARRAILGLFMLTVFVASSAWLLHAST
ncbi:MAG: hypothetical protein AAFO62_10850 [Pseudomonadota bacterium]